MAKEFTYKVKLEGEISSLTSQLKAAKTALSSVTNEGKEPKLGRILDSLGGKIDSLKTKAKTPIRSEAAFGGMEKDVQNFNRQLDHLGEHLEALRKKAAAEKIQFLPPDEQKRLSSMLTAIKTYDKAIVDTSKKTKELTDAEKAEATAKKNLEELNQKLAVQKTSAKTAQDARDTAKELLKQAQARQQAAKNAQAEYEFVQKAAAAAKAAEKNNPDDATKKVDLRTATFKNSKGEETTLNKARSDRNQAIALANKDDITALSDALKTAQSTSDSLTKSLGTTEAAIIKQSDAATQAAAKVKDLTGAYDKQKIEGSANAFATLRQEAQNLGVSLDGISTTDTPENVTALKDRINECVNQGVVPFDDKIQEAIGIQQNMAQAARETSEAIKRNTEQFRLENDQANQVNGLMNRIKQFTGITGVALVMRRSLQSALNTAKELDKQMTAMAVVTNLDVGDYWKQLSQHTEQANKLGVAIKDVYEAETLYYQQGLKTAQVQKLSTSTLKMARIAGLSAEDATNKMTAALRGFNMEINETNADRIADVYSKLAAITASNVKEISTAMTKTASLASNAGMEFETTAAFLSQIIETTRESAETAGTALKTVIARFQELKKSPEEIGEVEGEIVDANKIETALRTVGVALRDAKGQFRDLDDVFMDLSSKWDSLDTNTQRYIATIAAGSRQQSRFIAMMSDYSRTSELVNAANNAAGASNEQFEKTLDSLQSKLAQLKNAWTTFTQGLANNEFIKMGIGLLTGFLNILNKLTQGFNSISGSALKIAVVTAALIAGDKAVRIFTASVKGGTTVVGSFGAVLSGAATSIKNFGARLVYGIKNLTTNNKTLIVGGKVIKDYSTAETAAIAARNKATAATAVRKKAENDLNVALNAERPTMMAITKAQHDLEVARTEEVALTEEAKTAEADLMATLGLSSAQQKIYNDLKLAGIPTDQAAILASKGITDQKLTELATTSGLEKKQLAAIITQNAESKSKLGGVLASKLATAAAKMEGKGKIRSALASKLATVANWMLTASLGVLALIILAVVAAIAILVVTVLLIIKAFKAWKANTPEGKLKTANEVLKQSTQIANEAQESYNKLKDSLASLRDKYAALDDMTVGTQEWRDALLEVNSQVMDLIEKYPMLADAVEVDANGVMRISEETQQQVLHEQAAVVARTQSAKLAAQIAKNEAQANYDYSKLSDKAVAGNQSEDRAMGVGSGIMAGAATGGTIGTAIGGPYGTIIGAGIGAIGGAFAGGAIAYNESRKSNKEFTDQLASALADNQVQYFNSNGDIDKQALKAYMTDTMHMVPEAAQQWLNDLDESTLKKLKEYGKTLNQNAKAQEAALQTMISNAMTMVDVNNYSNEQVQQMNNIGTELADVLKSNAEESIKALSMDEYKDKAKKYFESLGYGDVEFKKDGTVTYKADGQTQTFTKAQVEAQLTSAEATDNLAEKLELLPKALDKALQKQGESGKALNNAFKDKEGKELTRNDLTNLEDNDLRKLYNSNKDLQEIFGNFEKFQEIMVKRVELANQAFVQNIKQLEKFGLEDIQLNQSLTSGAEEGLVKKLEEVTALSGTEAAKEVYNQIETILSHLNEEDKNKFVALLNSDNWHDADALEKLKETAKQLDIQLPELEFDNLIESLKLNAKAIHKIDMEKLNENLLDLVKILDNIRTNQQQRTFEKDDYDKIIAANNSLTKDFVQNLDGTFTYIGNSMADIADAILKKSEELVREEQKRLVSSLDMRKFFDQLFKDSNGKQDISKTASRTPSEQRTFLKGIIKTASQKGLNLNDLGIDYFSSDTDEDTIDELSDKIILQIIKNLQGIGSKADLQNQLNTLVLQALTTTNLNQDAYLNTRTETAWKAESKNRIGELTADEVGQYQSERQALLSQANVIGIQEKDIEALIKYNQQLWDMEDALQTDTAAYKALARQANDYMQQVQKQTSYEIMYKAIGEQITKSYELLKSYQDTTSAMHQQQIVAEEMSKFNIKVTEDNYQALMLLTEAYLRGNENAFAQVLQLAGQVANVSENIAKDVYHGLEGQLIDTVGEKFGEDTLKFAQHMIDIGFARIDQTTNKFHWAWGELKDQAKEIVDEIDAWISPYNWLYNQNNLINAQIRERERLERKYNMAIEDGNASVKDLSDNLTAQAASIRENTKMQQNVYNQASEELKKYIEYFNGPQAESGFDVLKNAIGIGPNGGLVVDKEQLYRAKLSADAGSVVEEEIGKIEELIDTMHNAEDALQDNEDALRELSKTGKEEYNSGLERVTEGLRVTYQKEIDTLSAINDSINDAQTQLTDKLQEKIDDDRQAREKEEAEKNLTDKQAQLAYLQASGGSALEILQLQKEIDQDQQSYTDSLVDSAIDELTKANQQAADQRQEQIEIAQAQFDWWSEHDAVHDAEVILNESLKDIADGLAPENTGIAKLLYGTENVAAQSKEGIEDWYKELGTTANLAAIHAGLVGTGGVTGSITTFKNTLNSAQVATTNAVNEVEKNQKTYNAGAYGLLKESGMVTLSKADVANNTNKWAKMLEGIKNRYSEIQIPTEPIEVTMAGTKPNVPVPYLTKEEAENEKVSRTWRPETIKNGETLTENKNIGSSADVREHLYKINGKDYYYDDENNQYFSTSDISWNNDTSSFNIRSGATAIQPGAAEGQATNEDMAYWLNEKQTTITNETAKTQQANANKDYLNNFESESESESNSQSTSPETGIYLGYNTYWNRNSDLVNTDDLANKHETDLGAFLLNAKGLSSQLQYVDFDPHGYVNAYDWAKANNLVGGNLFAYSLDGYKYGVYYMDETHNTAWPMSLSGKSSNASANNAPSYLLEVIKFLTGNKSITIGQNITGSAGGRGRSYKTGGLADFTGPAWMDGTKSNPEMVLNATDTANFIELKNVLADILKGSSTTSSGMGNNYYNIDVHVDSIDSDYDIDSAAAHMKELIENDAMYRNVNAIQQIR